MLSRPSHFVTTELAHGKSSSLIWLHTRMHFGQPVLLPSLAYLAQLVTWKFYSPLVLAEFAG